MIRIQTNTRTKNMTVPPPDDTRRHALQLLFAGGAFALAGCLSEDDDDHEDDDDGHENNGDATDHPTSDDSNGATFTVESVGDDRTRPWGLAFVPKTTELLVTERDPGELILLDYEDESETALDGIPAVDAGGQGGLLDVAVYTDETNSESDDEHEVWVYLTYSAENGDGETATHLGRGRLDRDGNQLDEFEQIHVAEPFEDSTGHYGSRVIVGPDEQLYMTTGDRQFKNFGPEHISQDTTSEYGATLRLELDGSIPDDNPFVDDSDVQDSIYSYGHRNAQGMTVRPETKELWQSEHGEEDGDELNIIVEGGNYGWPLTHTGCEYGTDEPVGERPEDRDDVVNPVYYWECTTGGFPPAGMTFYDGEAFPDWQGDLFVGNLAGQYLGHFTVDGEGVDDVSVEEQEPLLPDKGWRVRDVAVEPDSGELYVAIDDESQPLVRLVPNEDN